MFDFPLQWLKQHRHRPVTTASHQTLRDRALARRLARIYEQEMELADVRGIHFYVKDQVVTLYGAVSHGLDRDLLVSMVRQIAGVRDVVDHLHIADSGPHPAHARGQT